MKPVRMENTKSGQKKFKCKTSKSKLMTLKHSKRRKWIIIIECVKPGISNVLAYW